MLVSAPTGASSGTAGRYRHERVGGDDATPAATLTPSLMRSTRGRASCGNVHRSYVAVYARVMSPSLRVRCVRQRPGTTHDVARTKNVSVLCPSVDAIGNHKVLIRRHFTEAL